MPSLIQTRYVRSGYGILTALQRDIRLLEVQLIVVESVSERNRKLFATSTRPTQPMDAIPM